MFLEKLYFNTHTMEHEMRTFLFPSILATRFKETVRTSPLISGPPWRLCIPVSFLPSRQLFSPRCSGTAACPECDIPLKGTVLPATGCAFAASWLKLCGAGLPFCTFPSGSGCSLWLPDVPAAPDCTDFCSSCLGASLMSASPLCFVQSTPVHTHVHAYMWVWNTHRSAGFPSPAHQTYGIFCTTVDVSIS